jgi:hypothetical protein
MKLFSCRDKAACLFTFKSHFFTTNLSDISKVSFPTQGIGLPGPLTTQDITSRTGHTHHASGQQFA